MSTETIEGNVQYQCDLCEERFKSVSDALNHSQENHPELSENENSDRGLWTNTPAEDEEERRAVNAIHLHEVRQSAAKLSQLSKMQPDDRRLQDLPQWMGMLLWNQKESTDSLSSLLSTSSNREYFHNVWSATGRMLDSIQESFFYRPSYDRKPFLEVCPGQNQLLLYYSIKSQETRLSIGCCISQFVISDWRRHEPQQVPRLSPKLC